MKSAFLAQRFGLPFNGIEKRAPGKVENPNR